MLKGGSTTYRQGLKKSNNNKEMHRKLQRNLHHFKSFFMVQWIIFKVTPRIELIVPMRIPGTNILVFATEVCVVKKAGGDETKANWDKVCCLPNLISNVELLVTLKIHRIDNHRCCSHLCFFRIAGLSRNYLNTREKYSNRNWSCGLVTVSLTVLVPSVISP